MDELIEVNRMDKTLLYTIMLSNGECLRALGINILDSWNFSANLLGYFRSPRGLQGAALVPLNTFPWLHPFVGDFLATTDRSAPSRRFPTRVLAGLLLELLG